MCAFICTGKARALYRLRARESNFDFVPILRGHCYNN